MLFALHLSYRNCSFKVISKKEIIILFMPAYMEKSVSVVSVDQTALQFWKF